MNGIRELLVDLIETHGIETLYVDVTINAEVRKLNTGEEDKFFPEIRERAVSEEEMKNIVGNRGNYSGTVDLHGDFCVEDKITTKFSVERVEDIQDEL